jgi:hypothetical protein
MVNGEYEFASKYNYERLKKLVIKDSDEKSPKNPENHKTTKLRLSNSQ